MSKLGILLSICIIIVFIGPQINAQNPKIDKYHAKVYGQVTNKYSGLGIPGVNVYFESIQKGSFTDANGNYEIIIPKGTFTIKFSRVDLKDEFKWFDIIENMEINLEMREKVLNLDEVTIYGEGADQNVKSLEVGKNTLNIERIKSLPAFMGEPDVIKGLLLLPGVSTVGEGASGFNVRGGGIDQNLILQDEGLIFNPSHVFGFFSVFNPALVKNATLYKGGIPSRYGGRLSSVLAVDLKEGSYNKVKVSGGLGLVSSNLSVEAPIIKNKLSVIAGVRTTYSDWLLQRAQNADLKNSTAFFRDFNLKLSYIANNRDKFTYSGYLSSDGFKFASDTVFDWSTANHALEWTHVISESTSMTTNLIIGRYNYEISDEKGLNSFEVLSDIKYKNIKFNFIHDLDKTHKFNFGAEAVLYDFEPGKRRPLSETSGVLPLEIEHEKSLEASAYIEDELKFNESLSMKLGVRFSAFYNLGPGSDFIYDDASRTNFNIIDTVFYDNNETISKYFGVEPRLVLNYSMNESSSVKFSYNRTRQYLHLISNTTASTPTDFWKTSNLYIPPENANQFSLGYYKNFINDLLETSLEVYYKSSDNIVDYKDGTVLLMNQNLEASLINGTAESYGLELYLNKKFGKLTGWTSYTFSRSFRTVNGVNREERINNGQRFAANYDKPHDITVAANYKVTPAFELSTNFTYSTGRPLTIPLSLYGVSNLTGIPNFSLRNVDRIPDYHRLDLSMTFKNRARADKKWDYSVTFSVYNVYGRRNAYSVFFKNRLGEPPSANKLSVLGSAFPSVTLNFNIK